MLEQAAAQLRALVVLIGPQTEVDRRAVVDVEQLGLGESRRIWAEVSKDELLAAALARRFRVALDEARAALASARDRVVLRGEDRPPTAEELAQAVREQGARRMSRSVTLARSAGLILIVIAAAEILGLSYLVVRNSPRT